MSKRFATALLMLAAFACWLIAVPSFADSQVRIVRLSDVEGDVQVDRATGQGFEKAFLNMPITEGVKLRTGDDGLAEVEFEDGSAVRVTPNSVVEFPLLSLRDSGAKASTVEIQRGTAYVNLRDPKSNEFSLKFGDRDIALTDPTHLRVEVGDSEAVLAVFKGKLELQGPLDGVEIGKNQTVTLDLWHQDEYTVAKNLEKDPYDEWDKKQEQYQDRYLASNSYNDYSPYRYGCSDLNYYGNFFMLPGYGMVWQPYFTNAAWDPFMNGAWMWYPGYGYTWVSGYPWGWTPYHYGSWIFAPSYGWLWQPGGAWTGWNTVPRVVNPPTRFVPPRPPTTPGRTTVVVNRGPAAPVAGPARKVMIRSDSAGMGIPRGSIRDLGKLNQRVNQQGEAMIRTSPTPVTPASGISAGSAARTAAAPAPRQATPRPAAPARPVTPRMSAPVNVPHSAPRMSEPPRMSAPPRTSAPAPASRPAAPPHR